MKNNDDLISVMRPKNMMNLTHTPVAKIETHAHFIFYTR
jgi:hypothetical protein